MYQYDWKVMEIVSRAQT